MCMCEMPPNDGGRLMYQSCVWIIMGETYGLARSRTLYCSFFTILLIIARIPNVSTPGSLSCASGSSPTCVMPIDVDHSTYDDVDCQIVDLLFTGGLLLNALSVNPSHISRVTRFCPAIAVSHRNLFVRVETTPNDNSLKFMPTGRT